MSTLKAIVKKIHAAIPFKMELFSLLKKAIGTPSLSMYQHLYFKGVFEVKIDQDKSFKLQHYGYPLENDIFWTGLYGVWEKESLKLWTRLCQDAQVIVDVGANTGVYSLLAKTINPTAQVYAFEPVARVCQKLVHNIKLNNFDIVALEKAASNYNGTAVLYDTPTEHQYGATMTLRNHTAITNTVETEVETITLTAFAEMYGLTGIDLIKIDAERHEAEVLQGFIPRLYTSGTTFLIEIIDVEVATNIQQIFEGTTYLFFNIDEKLGATQVKNLTRSDGFNFLICTAEKAKAIKLI